ncbi:Tad domain-containing protein [Neorhodopirellula pilleata]|uniref:Uncharacterized protein n=1 Tax=Neorhodopirellula pilleata TaxID=2714738 RepID=A0A5C6AUK1_9BACT|nr:Tad domain-containing protein [Neorhodopirellula pilleata]TWU03693.1 hypothetical protein Pla100_06230 [Neorhodopirellula pilleata]
MIRRNQTPPIAHRLFDLTISWHRNESGTVAFSIPVGLFFFMVFAGLLFNTGATINGKIETQNAADASVYSASVSIARGLNAMTASNHLIGELNALYVIHHSLGGTWLDDKGGQENNSPEIQAANTGLEIAYNIAKNSQPIPGLQPPYDRVKKNPKADANSTIYEGKLKLKTALAIAYGVHTAGWVMYEAGKALLPFPTTPAGVALMAAGVITQVAATVTELAIMKEYLVLEGLEILARSLSPFKKGIPGTIKLLYNYQKLVGGTNNTPSLFSTLAAKSAIKIAERNDAVAIPSSTLLATATNLIPPFPVEQEKTTKIDRSQLMRAAFPWVAYWTNNIAGTLKKPFHILGAPISGAGGSFEKWSEKYAYQSVELFRGDTSRNFQNELTRVNHNKANSSGSGEKGMGIKLYVMQGLNETDNGAGWHKSMEDFNDWDNRRKASTKIDQLFCHVGFVRSENQPKVGVRRFFRQENPDGFVCYAQSMVYNANPQQRPQRSGGGGSAQPTVGYDTLGWTAGAIEYPGKSSARPQIKLNWQAKLTPITPEKLLSKAQVLLTDASLRRSFWGGRESILILNNH